MGVDWYKFVGGFVVLVRKKQNIENMSIATIGHQLQKKGIEDEFSRPLTATFNNMRTLKFKAQPTNGFFAAVNQVFGGSS